jgi:hypothetical protein
LRDFFTSWRLARIGASRQLTARTIAKADEAPPVAASTDGRIPVSLIPSAVNLSHQLRRRHTGLVVERLLLKQGFRTKAKSSQHEKLSKKIENRR